MVSPEPLLRAGVEALGMVGGMVGVLLAAVAFPGLRLPGPTDTELVERFRATGLTNYNFTSGRLKDFNIGGAFRWESKASIGFGAAAPETSGPYQGTVLFLDNNKPYWDKARYYFDVSAGYKFKLWGAPVIC